MNEILNLIVQIWTSEKELTIKEYIGVVEQCGRAELDIFVAG